MKEDFRTNRTRARIHRALIEALQQKPFNKVTVTELIRFAKISRRSFYVHYHDKYELLTEIEAQIINELTRTVEKQNQSLKPVENINDPQLVINTTQVFQKILRAMQSQRTELATLLSDNGDYQFKVSLQRLIEKTILTRLQNYHAKLRSDIPRDYTNTILVWSLMDLIIIWLRKKRPETPAKFAEILTRSRLIAPLELLQF